MVLRENKTLKVHEENSRRWKLDYNKWWTF